MKAHLLKKHLNNCPDDAEILIRKPNGVLVEVDMVRPCFDGLLLSNCDVEEFEFNREIIRKDDVK